MTRSFLMPLAAILCLATGTAVAEEHGAECAMTYGVFEGSVPHTDMENCPASMEAGEDAFCRVAVVAEVATVFVFSYDTNCLVTTQSFYEEDFTFVIN